MKKILLCFAVIVSLFMSTCAANVTIDGESFLGAKLIGSVTYVPLRAFCDEVSDCNISWDAKKREAIVDAGEVSLSAKISDMYIESKGRYLYSGNENILINGTTYVPIRSLAKVFGAEVEWDARTRTANLETNAAPFQSADEYYNGNDLWWLAKIISAESAGEPLLGKIAVGNVVLNRVENSEYPNNIYDVIFDTNGGVQFTPVLNGTINNPPTDESIMAAKICLEDFEVTDRDVLFFLNPTISQSFWITENRDFVMTVGKHDFYA